MLQLDQLEPLKLHKIEQNQPLCVGGGRKGKKNI